MTEAWHDATRVLYQLHARETTGTARCAALLVDPAVVSTPIEEKTCGWLRYHGWTAETTVVEGPGDAASIMALAESISRARLVVALGGGSVMDQAKLATVACDAAGHLSAPQRAGLIVLPAQICRTVALVAVPTTLGTGSESSMVACLTTANGKRLVAGAALRPDAAVLDPLATQTLPGVLIQEAVLEALVRVVSPYVGDHHGACPQDQFAEIIAARLVELGFAVRDVLASGGTVDPQTRADIARLSGYGHATWLCRSGDPYAVKGWMIANELSSALRVRKMTAFAALLPHLWRRICDHDVRLGSACRLRQIWARMRQATDEALPADPADGIAALVGSWRLPHRLDLAPHDIPALARRIARAWGGGLPMLPLTVGEISALLGDLAQGDAACQPSADTPLVMAGG